MFYPATHAPADTVPAVHRLVRFSVALLIFVSLALPSGSLFGIPFKYMAYGLTVISLLGLWVRQRVALPRWLLTLGVLVTAFVVFFVLVGLVHAQAGPPFIIKEATGIFTTLTIVLFVLAARSQGVVDDRDIMRWAFYGALVFAFWKSCLVFGLVSRVLTYAQVSAFFMEQAGYRLVSSGIFGGWVRINLIIYDFIVAVMLFLVPTYPALFEKVPRLLRWAFIFFGFSCLMFAFSRLLFGLEAALLLFAYLFRYRRVTRIALTIAAVCVLTAAAPWLQGAFEQRFKSSGNDASDELRTEQIHALANAWSENPVLGGGFGSFARDMIRDPSAPYNYEVQWAGFLAKLGIVGVLVLVLLVAALYVDLFRAPLVPEHVVVAFALSSFVLGGFTNQYLVTSGSGVFYCMVLALSRYFRQLAPAARRSA